MWRALLATWAAMLVLTSTTTTGKRMTTRMSGFQSDDALLTVTPISRERVLGECTCKCCEEPAPAPLIQSCPNDIVIAVDSSACFRDHHSRMMKFLQKLIHRIGREQQLAYGGTGTRLGLMQFSSDIVFPIELGDYEDYTNPSSNRALMNQIAGQLQSLRFLGEGAFLNKALNATVDHFSENPRPRELLEEISATGKSPRKVVIVLTNGKSHPSVTMDDIELSIAGLRNARTTVMPVSVTRECHGVIANEWNEGLCPDTVTLNALAKIGRSRDSSFMEMKSQDTLPDILNELKACYGGPSELNSGPPCNNCTCSCELPVGPPGAKGTKGEAIQGEDGPKGDVGERGRPGEKGDQGNDGRVGPKGEQGVIGPKGEVGEQGPKGAEGRTGDPGVQGVPGVKGNTGDEGRVGPKGDEGEPGLDGERGEVGPKGERGPQGEEGERGPEGPRGPQGAKGVGEPGIPGEIGRPGLKGEPGDRGFKGMTDKLLKGDKGNRGLCGKPGPAGTPGEDGGPGLDGRNGEMGPAGPEGPRGDEGVPGQKGEEGMPGIDGFPGSRGLTGERGPRGTEGPAGPKGEKGEPSSEPGPAGINGNPGAQGERGFPGVNGLDGRQGGPGPQGPRGEPGRPGPAGEYDLERLRPIIAEIVRELLPGDCAEGPPEVRCNEYPVDLTFLVDGSDSIDREDFAQVQDWIMAVINAFAPDRRSIPLLVNVVQFSERSQIEISQTVKRAADEIRDQLRAIEQMRSGTKTYSALEFVNEQVYSGLRDGSYKILITMTDGDASEDRNNEAIAVAQASFQMMIAVGVGEKVDEDELADFAKGEEIFHVTDFAALEGVIETLVDDICQGIELIQQETGESITTTVATTEPAPTTTPAAATTPVSTETTCTEALTDLAFVLDGSSSVGDDGFDLLKGFLSQLVTSFTRVGADGVQVAIMQYNDNPRLEFDFEDSRDRDAVVDAIAGLEYMSGNTNTGAALRYLRTVYDQIEGARTEARKVAVVITDGRSQDDVATPAAALRRSGATIFAIGVGEAEMEDLIQIASPPSEEFVFSVEDYAAIESIRETVLQRICTAALGVIRNGDDDEEPSPPEDYEEFTSRGDYEEYYDYSGEEKDEFP